MMLSDGKLLSIFPWVLDPKDKNPAIAMIRHMTIEIVVE
jgi:hypothetical protein